MEKQEKNLLEVKDLTVEYHTNSGVVHAVSHLNLTVGQGETLGFVGETGAGKTTTALSIMNLLPYPQGKILSGSIKFNGEEIIGKSKKEMTKIRGEKISMIFQDPMSSLNPVITVGDQIAEVIETHEKCSHKEACEKAREMLLTVGIPGERADDYPHQFSGGMKQRVIIAIALACNPKILIADEPTTALDVTIQAQVLEMMRELKAKYSTATILITHDLGIVAQMCERVAIVYAGEIVEEGNLQDIFKETAHPYTEGLLGAIPQIQKNVKRLTPIDGLMPDPVEIRKGCAFADRCKYASDHCQENHPDIIEITPGHKTRCFYPDVMKGGDRL